MRDIWPWHWEWHNRVQPVPRAALIISSVFTPMSHNSSHTTLGLEKCKIFKCSQDLRRATQGWVILIKEMNRIKTWQPNTYWHLKALLSICISSASCSAKIRLMVLGFGRAGSIFPRLWSLVPRWRTKLRNSVYQTERSSREHTSRGWWRYQTWI